MLKHVTVFDRSTETKVEAKLVIRGIVRELTLCKPGKEFESDTFMVGNTPMVISVCPNGGLDQYKGHMSVFLKNISKVDTKILHFQEVDCILLIIFLSAGKEETRLLSLHVLLEVEGDLPADPG